MLNVDIEQIDESLEAAALLRASEEKFARASREGYAFGREEDQRRLDAFTLGLLDALAEVMGTREETLRLLVYVHAAQRHGPGSNARQFTKSMLEFASTTNFEPYVAAGRKLVFRTAVGAPPEAGRFARLLEQELHGS